MDVIVKLYIHYALERLSYGRHSKTVYTLCFRQVAMELKLCLRVRMNMNNMSKLNKKFINKEAILLKSHGTSITLE